MEVFRNISIKLVADEETPIDEGLKPKTCFLQAAIRFDLGVIVGSASPEMDLSKLGHLWEEIKPNGEVFEFELATELPYYLPTLEGKPEYFVNVGGLELFVCSRMVRAFCGDGYPKAEGTTYALVHRKALKSLAEFEDFKELHPIPMRAFISAAFSAAGANAEQVIQQNFIEWRDQFVLAISHLIDSLRITDPAGSRHLLPYPSSAAFPLFWVVAGRQMGTQFVGELGLAAFRALSNVTAAQRPQFENRLGSGVTPLPHEHALGLARTFSHYGYLGFAIVQICVAVETVLARAYTDYVLSKGVSNKVLKDNRKDITFSQLLNIHLFAMRNIQELNDWKNVIDTLNWARRNRNDVVHQGALEQEVTSGEVNQAIEKASALINFLIPD